MPNDYLALLGVQRWYLRQKSMSPTCQSFLLLQDNKPFATLLVESVTTQEEHTHALQTLLVNMFKAIGLTLQEQLSSSSVATEWLITMRLAQSSITFPQPVALNLPHPLDLLLTPVKKREAWIALRAFGVKHGLI